MPLYSKDGGWPKPLPFRIVLPDGFTRTDPETFTPSEIEEAGYVAASDPPAFDAETQELTWAEGGWLVTDRPAPPEPALPPLTILAFMQLSTPAERIAARALAETDAIAADFLALLDVATSVELDHPSTIQGVGYLAIQGIYSPERAAAILSGTPPA